MYHSDSFFVVKILILDPTQTFEWCTTAWWKGKFDDVENEYIDEQMAQKTPRYVWYFPQVSTSLKLGFEVWSTTEDPSSLWTLCACFPHFLLQYARETYFVPGLNQALTLRTRYFQGLGNSTLKKSADRPIWRTQEKLGPADSRNLLMASSSVKRQDAEQEQTTMTPSSLSSASYLPNQGRPKVPTKRRF